MIQPMAERYAISKDLFVCKMTEDRSVSETCTHIVWVHAKDGDARRPDPQRVGH